MCRCEAAGVVRSSMSACACAMPMMRINMVDRGKAVSNAVSAGHRELTKPLRKIQSMGRDIEGWDVNEVQIPGTKIEI